jgi:RNA-directed DNA polymerase
MTVKALTPVRTVNLVAPLAQKATVMHTTDTAASVQARSGAASTLIGSGLRGGGMDSANWPPTPGIATSTTETRTTTTRAPKARLLPSADFEI